MQSVMEPSRAFLRCCSQKNRGEPANGAHFAIRAMWPVPRKNPPWLRQALVGSAWPTILSLLHPSVPHKSTPCKPHDDEDADIRKKLDRVRNQKWQHRRCGQIWTSEVGCTTSCHGCRGHHALRVSGCALLRARLAHSGPGPTGGHAYRQRRAGGLVGSATAQLTSHDIHAT